jgi:ribonuclease III
LGRLSTTSQRTSSRSPVGKPDKLKHLIDTLPRQRLEQALAHPYWAPDRASSYERLEFLGDSVLDLAVARYLFERHPDFSEGEMTKILAYVRSRASCAAVALELGLDERLLRRGEEAGVAEAPRLARNRNVLAAVVEAALAALLLEHGFAIVEPAVVDAFSGRIEYASTQHVDFKTALQEALARRRESVTYRVVAMEGPPHDRRFTSAASVAGEELGAGTGLTKKEAEQAAAREALERLGEQPSV